MPVSYSGQSYLQVPLLQWGEQSSYHTKKLYPTNCCQIELLCEVLHMMY